MAFSLHEVIRNLDFMTLEELRLLQSELSKARNRKIAIKVLDVIKINDIVRVHGGFHNMRVVDVDHGKSLVSVTPAYAKDKSVHRVKPEDLEILDQLGG